MKHKIVFAIVCLIGITCVVVSVVQAEPNTETFKTIDSTTLEVTIRYSLKKSDIEAEKTALLARIAAEKVRIDLKYQPELDRLNSQLAEF